MTKPALANAEIHLKRAYTLLSATETATEDLGKYVEGHSEDINKPQDWASVITGYKSAFEISKQKSDLLSDLDLAAQELEHAQRLDASATIPIEKTDTHIGIPAMRSVVAYQRGLIELTWGSPQSAEIHFLRSIESLESPETYLMLATVAEMQYRPVDALRYYEKCLELDPAGKHSATALRGANAMRNYKKRFRGNWNVFLVLLLFWPAAIVYFFAKRK